MMNRTGWWTKELIRLLLLHPPRKQSRLIEWTDKYREADAWEEIQAYWESHFDEDERPLDGSGVVEGIGEMFRGLADFRKGELESARWYFSRAQWSFECENDWYRMGLAVMAQGLTFELAKTREDPESARTLYERSLQLFSGLCTRYAAARDGAMERTCDALAGRLKGMIERLGPSISDWSSVLLLPHAGITAAGEPAFHVDDAVAHEQTSLIKVDDRVYRVLSVETRSAIEDLRLRGAETYFTLDVQGDSMKRDGAGIFSGDRILVRKSAGFNPCTEPKKGIFVVVVGDDLTPPTSVAKRVECDESQILKLHSDNREYEILEVPLSAARIVGEVVAVLDPVPDFEGTRNTTRKA